MKTTCGMSSIKPHWKCRKLSSNPRTWQSWMVYLLGRLEAQATQNAAQMESFKEMLASLQDELRNRLKTGGW